jgi:hypothetical protein
VISWAQIYPFIFLDNTGLHKLHQKTESQGRKDRDREDAPAPLRAGVPPKAFCTGSARAKSNPTPCKKAQNMLYC